MSKIIATRADLHYYLERDLIAQGYGPNWSYAFMLTRRVAYYQRVLRFCEFFKNTRKSRCSPRYLLSRYRLLKLSEKLGFDIPLNVFGPGLSIAHAGPIIVNSGARVGAGCRIHHGLTIGAIGDGVPVIGDNVFIGPDVGIYGGVRIGGGVVIGPGSQIKSSVSSGSRVDGPSATISKRAKGAWMNPHLRPRQVDELGSTVSSVE